MTPALFLGSFPTAIMLSGGNFREGTVLADLADAVLISATVAELCSGEARGHTHCFRLKMFQVYPRIGPSQSQHTVLDVDLRY